MSCRAPCFNSSARCESDAAIPHSARKAGVWRRYIRSAGAGADDEWSTSSVCDSALPEPIAVNADDDDDDELGTAEAVDIDADEEADGDALYR